ncbi:hypothetical protein N9879_00925, partial [bacterium]|nr:hypothetical protein [bacterium]
AQIEFLSGVSLVVEGDAEFEILSSDEMNLVRCIGLGLETVVQFSLFGGGKVAIEMPMNELVGGRVH